MGNDINNQLSNFFLRRIEKIAKNSKHLVLNTKEAAILILRTKSTDYVHAPSYLMGSLCGDDEIELTVDFQIHHICHNAPCSGLFPLVVSNKYESLLRCSALFVRLSKFSNDRNITCS